MSNLVIGLFPRLHNRFVTFFLRQQTTAVFLGNNFNRIFRLLQKFFLGCRHFHIRNGYRHSRLCGVFVSQRLNRIQRLCRLCCTFIINTFLKNLLQLLLSYVKIHFQFQEIIRIAAVHKTKILTDNLIENKPPQSGLNNAGLCYSFRILAKTANFNFSMKRNFMIFIGNNCLIHILEKSAGSFGTLLLRSFLSQIVNTKNHILRRYCYRTTIGWFQQVVW